LARRRRSANISKLVRRSLVVEVALQSFFGPETLSDNEREELNRCIDEALAEAVRGETIDGPEAMREIRQQLASRRLLS
jgi:hypothetical protein